MKPAHASNRDTQFPDRALGLGAVDAVSRLHPDCARLADQQFVLLLSGRPHSVPDSESIVLLDSLGLNTHLEGADSAYEMPLPIRTIDGFVSPVGELQVSRRRVTEFKQRPKETWRCITDPLSRKHQVDLLETVELLDRLRNSRRSSVETLELVGSESLNSSIFTPSMATCQINIVDQDPGLDFAFNRVRILKRG